MTSLTDINLSRPTSFEDPTNPLIERSTSNGMQRSTSYGSATENPLCNRCLEPFESEKPFKFCKIHHYHWACAKEWHQQNIGRPYCEFGCRFSRPAENIEKELYSETPLQPIPPIPEYSPNLTASGRRTPLEHPPKSSHKSEEKMGSTGCCSFITSFIHRKLFSNPLFSR